MNNLRIDVTCKGRGALIHVLSLLDYKITVGYHCDINPEGMSKIILYWTDSPKAMMFPGKGKTHEESADFILAWLKEIKYGPQPRHDGHNTKGWRAYNEMWGYVNREWQAMIVVEPVWAIHGK